MTPELSQSYQLTSILSIINLSNIHAEWKASKSSYLVKNKIQICLFTSKKKKNNKQDSRSTWRVHSTFY